MFLSATVREDRNLREWKMSHIFAGLALTTYGRFRFSSSRAIRLRWTASGPRRCADFWPREEIREGRVIADAGSAEYLDRPIYHGGPPSRRRHFDCSISVRAPLAPNLSISHAVLHTNKRV